MVWSCEYSLSKTGLILVFWSSVRLSSALILSSLLCTFALVASSPAIAAPCEAVCEAVLAPCEDGSGVLGVLCANAGTDTSTTSATASNNNLDIFIYFLRFLIDH